MLFEHQLIDLHTDLGFNLEKARSTRHPAKTITDVVYADDLALLSDTMEEATKLLHYIEEAASEIGLYINAGKTKFISYNQEVEIKSKNNNIIKSVKEFVYLGSNINSTERDIQIRKGKAWGALEGLNIIWKSSLTDQLKRNFFKAAVESVLIYGSTTWTLKKHQEALLDGTYTRMLHAALKISWKKHPTKKRLYGHLPPISVSLRERRLRLAGHSWRSKSELASDTLLWNPMHRNRSIGRPCRTYIDQLADDSGCHLNDLPTAMSDREGWRERVKFIREEFST